jgi:hypothetical protein
MVSSLPDSYTTANVSHRQPWKTNRKPAPYNKCAQILLALRINCNADDTSVLYDTMTNITIDAKGSKSVLLKTKGHENLILSVMADGRKHAVCYPEENKSSKRLAP